ncbi:unnamed protein product [Cyprideis torosa]|uniref:Uncharacterized protein n=1 Tax=Cyprideis torosa TaxID=163714 RepID=A0A7R8WW08_9CRUS|nr:unnamed protein product [Cyprideis torosa]CAG0906990.1 unnamed protein product [Cyprideis torosa]
MRASRLSTNLHDNCLIYTETNTQQLISELSKQEVDLLIIDSIQTLYSDQVEAAAGSISQIRQCAYELIQYAKANELATILIGHINKEGQIAGPKILEHMVDVVLQFEGDRNHMYRLLRSQKNRYGPSSELGIFEMGNAGLIEVDKPQFVLMNSEGPAMSGNAVGIMQEGARPMSIEVQALVSSAVYGTPQRAATGFDSRRLNMLLAVLEKRVGFPLASKDVFLNMTGGLRVDDTAIDLAVVAAILSSATDIPLSKDLVLCAEIGLSGELRPVAQIDKRINEASKLGYKTIVVAKESKTISSSSINVVCLEKVEALRDFLFA